MIRRILCLALFSFLLCSCSILSSEERTFAVALAVDWNQGWHVCARVPTYRQDTSYLTLEASADTLVEAVAALNQHAPMQLHLGQVRTVIIGSSVVQSGSLSEILEVLTLQRDLRQDAVLLVTDSSIRQVCDAMTPSTGVRLSKALDELLKTRHHQGLIPLTTIADVSRFSDRQALPVALLYLQDQLDMSAFQLEGCCLFDAHLAQTAYLTASETQLLLMLNGQWKRGVLYTNQQSYRVAEAKAQLRLDPPYIDVKLKLQLADLPASRTEAEQTLQQAVRLFCTHISQSKYDALGVGRQAIRYFNTQASWSAADWPRLYSQLQWNVSVTIEQPLSIHIP